MQKGVKNSPLGRQSGGNLKWTPPRAVPGCPEHGFRPESVKFRARMGLWRGQDSTAFSRLMAPALGGGAASLKRASEGRSFSLHEAPRESAPLRPPLAVDETSTISDVQIIMRPLDATKSRKKKRKKKNTIKCSNVKRSNGEFIAVILSQVSNRGKSPSLLSSSLSNGSGGCSSFICAGFVILGLPQGRMTRSMKF